MPNDVSAFITPVRDLNDEPCALVKVEAPSDFAFSTPLGIVSRKDKVGEIWRAWRENLTCLSTRRAKPTK